MAKPFATSIGIPFLFNIPFLRLYRLSWSSILNIFNCFVLNKALRRMWSFGIIKTSAWSFVYNLPLFDDDNPEIKRMHTSLVLPFTHHFSIISPFFLYFFRKLVHPLLCPLYSLSFHIISLLKSTSESSPNEHILVNE